MTKLCIVVRVWKYMVLMLCLWSSTSWAQGNYRPGDVVPEPYLKVFGHEQFFKVSTISEPLQALMVDCSMRPNSPITWGDLRYLQVLHRDSDGNAIVGEMVCNVVISNDLMEIFRALFEAGYPIERMRLIDRYEGDDEASMSDNNTSCFNQRPITAGGRISKHSYGLAIDINPRYNPYNKVKPSGKSVVKPQESVDYLDRGESFPYKIEKGDLCYRLFRQHGFRWGGEWASGKDYQHFEK